VKQTKTTLIFGVLLAIIVLIIVTIEINNATQLIYPIKTESALGIPTVQKSISVLKYWVTLLVY